MRAWRHHRREAIKTRISVETAAGTGSWLDNQRGAQSTTYDWYRMDQLPPPHWPNRNQVQGDDRCSQLPPQQEGAATLQSRFTHLRLTRLPVVGCKSGWVYSTLNLRPGAAGAVLKEHQMRPGRGHRGLPSQLPETLGFCFQSRALRPLPVRDEQVTVRSPEPGPGSGPQPWSGPD